MLDIRMISGAHVAKEVTSTGKCDNRRVRHALSCAAPAQFVVLHPLAQC
jgi:hypothetical protein